MISVLYACEENPKGYYQYRGNTMGTYYSVTFETTDQHTTQADVEKVLADVNTALSTYISTSQISKFNQSKKGITLPRQDSFLRVVYLKAKEYHDKTNGIYDPTVLPLVNHWGFGSEAVDKSKKREHRRTVDSLLQFVVMDSIEYIEHNGYKYLRKLKKGMQLDFSSIAKGYGIDVLSEYLERKGVKNYLVDIGGEAKASGFNKEGQVWKIAINRPDEEATPSDVELVITLDEKSIATSGNYRNVYTIDGKKYSHTINPRTGYPERSNLLSATVIADDCVDADAIATVLMVSGLKKGKLFLSKASGVEACMIYDADGDDHYERFYTDGFKQYVVE